MTTPLLQRTIAHRIPMRIVHLPLLGLLQRAAVQPRRRVAKRFIGKPVKKLYRLAHGAGLAGEGVFALTIGATEHSITFNARNTQFLMPDDGFGYEPELAALLDILLDDDGVFFDIGSNWSYFGLYVLSRPGFTGTVHAFEAYPPTFRDLETVARQTPFADRFVRHATALSDHAGHANFGLIDTFSSGLARMEGTHDGMRVTVQRLDDLALPSPTVIKIDVEGHEANVLEGGRATFAAARPFIVFENWLEFAQPRLTLEPFAVLRGIDYRFFVPTWIYEANGQTVALTATNPKSKPSNRFGLVEIDAAQRFLMSSQINVLACPTERSDELAARFART